MFIRDPKHDDAVYESRLREVSCGDLCPMAGRTVRGGVYDSLIIPEGVTGVTLERVIILGSLTIADGSVAGSIYVPDDNPQPDVGRNSLLTLPKVWRMLAAIVGLTPDEWVAEG